MSPSILSRNLSSSTLILRGDGLTINLSVVQAVHIKSEDLGNLVVFKL
jgi:hypothetical protein